MTKTADFSTLDDEVTFWETHSSVETWDELEKVDFEIDLLKNLLHPRLSVLARKPDGNRIGAEHLETITIDYVTPHYGRLIAIREVPAYRSAGNDREYILEETLDQIERLLELEHNDQVQPVDTLQIPVFLLEMAA